MISLLPHHDSNTDEDFLCPAIYIQPALTETSALQYLIDLGANIHQRFKVNPSETISIMLHYARPKLYISTRPPCSLNMLSCTLALSS